MVFKPTRRGVGGASGVVRVWLRWLKVVGGAGHVEGTLRGTEAKEEEAKRE